MIIPNILENKKCSKPPTRYSCPFPQKIGSQSRSIDHPNFHGWSMLISSAFKTYFWLAPSAKSWLGKTIWRPWRPWRPWWKEVQNVGSDDFGAIESENSKVVEPYTRRFPQMGGTPSHHPFSWAFPLWTNQLWGYPHGYGNLLLTWHDPWKKTAFLHASSIPPNMKYEVGRNSGSHPNMWFLVAWKETEFR